MKDCVKIIKFTESIIVICTFIIPILLSFILPGASMLAKGENLDTTEKNFDQFSNFLSDYEKEKICFSQSVAHSMDESLTIVKIEPEILNVEIGTFFFVGVFCEPTRPLRAFEFSLSYNASLIQATEIIEGDIFNGYVTLFNNGIIDDSIGQIKQTYGLILGPGNVTNSGYLAYINFTTMNISGQSLLDLFDVGVTNETAYFPNNNANGLVNIISPENNDDNLPPVLINESPLNNTQNILIYQQAVSIFITDPENRPINWTIQGKHIQNTGLNYDTNGNKKATLTTPLPYNNTITWFVNVTDGIKWTNKSFSFTTQSETALWQYRKIITIDEKHVISDLIDFPLLIHLIDADLSSKAQDDGDDIYFTDLLDNKLNHEIEYYNNKFGELVAWVKVPFLSSINATTIYMYYGNPGSSNQENVEGVWDSSYLAVHHINKTSGIAYDSTSYDNDGTPVGGLDQDISGYIDGAASFDGVDDFVLLPQVFSMENQFTFETWIYADTGARYFLSQWHNYEGSFLQVGATPDRIEWFLDNTGISYFGITLDQWYHVVGSYDGMTARLYVNGGTPISNPCSAPTWPAEELVIGDRLAGGRSFHGVIDEVRLSDVARSDAWVQTEYNNQVNPSSFYSVGPEDTVNMPPEKPDRPIGPTDGKYYFSYDYYSSTFDIDGDLIYYQWEWMSEVTSNWYGPYDSNDICTVTFNWDSPGEYTIRVRARDEYNAVSEWSDPIVINLQKSKVLFFRFPFIEILFNRFINLRNLFILLDNMII
jgi:hypothetical protein